MISRIALILGCLTLWLVVPAPGSGSGAQAQEPLRLAYLIPGSDKEPGWLSAHAFAVAAAEDLGFTLEVHYAFNDARRLIEIAKTVTGRPADKPHYPTFPKWLAV